MDNQFIINRLQEVAAAVTQIELQNNQIKNVICVLRGYVQSDADFPIVEQGGLTTQNCYQQTDYAEVLEFTDKEISKMPKQFRTIFKTNGVRARVRKRKRNNSVSYEIRYRCNGYNISASGITLAEAKIKFIQKLNDAQNGITPSIPDIPTAFDKFAIYYFEKFRKRKVKPMTYVNDMWRLNKYIIPHFGNIRIKDITPQLCQRLIDSIAESGKSKTAEEVFSLLNCTLKTAIKHNLIQHNPLDIVIHDKHERVHGKALTIEEERYMLETATEPCRTWLAIALYTGMRPNEYPTARIVGDLIHANNSKRHNGKQETKRIPITPMLRPFLCKGLPPTVSLARLRSTINSIFDGTHKLYDLRTTFYTRCQMCGVAPAARDEFVGHSSGVLAKTYTDLPDDYLIQESKKLVY